MRRADAVIGAGFGDEGKGLVTDSLASGYGMEAIVVRFNGGAQARHTGIRNVMTLARAAGFEKIDVVYVTRPYTVRHGAGPLPHELEMPPYPRIEDDTNVCNLYQSRLRFGWLDLDLMARSIVNDLLDKADGVEVRHRIAVSCMDQVDDKVTVVTGAQLQSSSPGEFLQQALRATQAEAGLVSFGPTRMHVESFKAGDEMIFAKPRKGVVQKTA